ncbi:MAG: putative transport system ATP-binding protein [Gaiellales bacterium]|jgi:putative ABC transport system ATP-binding protein|nr:putative transport system ATP-binding protein [Gaiellales bacterium]
MAVASLYREPEAADTREPPALELLDVFRIYSSGSIETVALRGLSLRVQAGELVAVMGPSGSGKSTFLSLAAGLDTPSAGEVRVHGRPLSRMNEDQLAEYRARHVALVFQSGNLWPALSAQENVEMSLRLARGDDVPGRAATALATFGLAARRRHRAAALSGGEQQRVAIAAAAARRAPLVLADEPTGELDAANERNVVDALRRLREEHHATVVIVTHSARLAHTADRVIELRDGRVA